MLPRSSLTQHWNDRDRVGWYIIWTNQNLVRKPTTVGIYRTRRYRYNLTNPSPKGGSLDVNRGKDDVSCNLAVAWHWTMYSSPYLTNWYLLVRAESRETSNPVSFKVDVVQIYPTSLNNKIKEQLVNRSKEQNTLC